MLCIGGDVDRPDSVVRSEADLPQHPGTPTRRDRDIGSAVDHQHGTSLGSAGKLPRLLGNCPSSAQFGGHVTGNQRAIYRAHHIWS